MNPDNLGKVELKINLIVVLALFVIGMALVYSIFESSWNKRLEFYLPLCALGAAIYGAYYVGASLKQSIKRGLAQRSYELIDKLSEVDYVGVRRFIRSQIQNHKFESDNNEGRHKELQTKINTNDDLHDRVHHLLGFIESMSEQIQTGFVNEAILYEHCYYIVLNAYRHLREYIDSERSVSEDASELYMHVERLYDCWKEKKSLQTGCTMERI
jgi:Domain of unknown function (DUF4760)